MLKSYTYLLTNLERVVVNFKLNSDVLNIYYFLGGKMKKKIKIHDGIVGALILTSIVLSMNVNSAWIYLAEAVSLLMIISAFTGFCPVYFILNKIIKDDGSKCC